MKILTRYILNEFLKPFFLATAGFSVLFLLVQIFNDMHLIMEFKPNFLVTLKYFSFHIPSFIIQIIPIACLFGVLFSLSGLSKGNELIAMRAGGINIYYVAIPLFLSGIIICVSSILFNELVVPKAEALKRRIKSVEILHQPETETNKFRQDISMIGVGGQLYHIGAFDGTTNTLSDILILEFGPNSHLESRLDAKAAKYENSQWVFYDGYLRTFDDSDAEISAQPFDKMPLALPEKPSDFLKEQKEPNELNITELVAYINQLKRNGSDCHKELVELYYKFASPFGCVILAILGVPWGWTMRKYSGVVTSFLISMAVGFVYLGGMQIGQHLGEAGVISPFLSVWVVNVIFALLVPIMLAWKNR